VVGTAASEPSLASGRQGRIRGVLCGRSAGPHPNRHSRPVGLALSQTASDPSGPIQFVGSVAVALGVVATATAGFRTLRVARPPQERT